MSAAHGSFFQMQNGSHQKIGSAHQHINSNLKERAKLHTTILLVLHALLTNCNVTSAWFPHKVKKNPGFFQDFQDRFPNNSRITNVTEQMILRDGKENSWGRIEQIHFSNIDGNKVV